MRCKKCKKKAVVAQDVMTKFKCQICEKEDFWENSNTPKVCSSCSERFNKCEMCGADLDEKEI